MITRRVIKQLAFMADTSKYNRKQGKFKRLARYFNKDGLRRIGNCHRVKPNQVTKLNMSSSETAAFEGLTVQLEYFNCSVSAHSEGI